ncbi:DUF2268 domain-containing protein [Rossellomorea vietnamensis]|uniref:DUF2268 domain-containing protein n=1 Tax=Rossellomorea vietnamensis TaxID=218284 RepID=UPI003CEEDCDF
MAKTISLFAVMIIILVGCSNEEAVPAQSKVNILKEGQAFNLVPLYEEVLDYANSVEGQSGLTAGEYYTKVTQPFLDYASSENSSLKGGLDYSPYFYPTKKPEALAETARELLKQQEDINKAIEDALGKSANSLPGGKKTIFIKPAAPEDTFTKYMEGVGAVTLSKDAILLILSPSYEEEMLKYVVAHEYHHSVLMEKDDEAGFTLLEGIIFEGKAESFASRLYPRVKAPWTEQLTTEEENTVLNVLDENMKSTSIELYNEFHEGNFTKGLPIWSNYKIGYKIMENFLAEHPDMTVKEWTMADETKIVKNSSFSYLLQ